MPVIEYIKQQKRRGNTIQKGTQQVVTWALANKLAKKEVAVIVGKGSDRKTQDRTRAVNRVSEPLPNESNTVKEIKDYLDEQDISYSSKDNKPELLTKIK
jgi:hypothetical protein